MELDILVFFCLVSGVTAVEGNSVPHLFVLCLLDLGRCVYFFLPTSVCLSAVLPFPCPLKLSILPGVCWNDAVSSVLKALVNIIHHCVYTDVHVLSPVQRLV